MNTTVVVDTGPLVAVADRDDAHHRACVGGWLVDLLGTEDHRVDRLRGLMLDADP